MNNGPLRQDIESLSLDFVRDLGLVRLLVFDFDGVFTDNRVYVSQDGVESVACWRSDGLGIAKVKQLGIPIWVVSTEANPVVRARCEKLRIDCVQNCDEKLSVVRELAQKQNVSVEETVYVGNDINDYDCLEEVGLPVVVMDAHPDVVGLARYITMNGGGRGAVREICDLIVDAKEFQGKKDACG
jgi:3-deoxy-D-manno-octulosonate 8-phosphate phosphatase (KDO 8-P phosphatase)